jgi:hypothetical protein
MRNGLLLNSIAIIILQISFAFAKGKEFLFTKYKSSASMSDSILALPIGIMIGHVSFYYEKRKI